MTSADLKARTVKDLSAIAKKKKVPGWQSMKKDQLIRALLQHARSTAPSAKPARLVKSLRAPKASGVRESSAPSVKAVAKIVPSKIAPVKANGKGTLKTAKPTSKSAVATKPVVRPKPVAKLPPRDPELERRLAEVKERHAQAVDLGMKPVDGDLSPVKDRLVVMVRDPYWLHAYWEINGRSVDRAKAAMNHYWHSARPVLRVNEVIRDGVSISSRKTVRDIDVHGGVNNWYIDVQQPPKSYQLEIGYLASNGNFYSLARSNVATTPAADSEDAFDRNWSDVARNVERIYALSGGYSDPEANGELKEVLEERLQRQVGAASAMPLGLEAPPLLSDGRDFKFEVDTELIVHGQASPSARVTLRGEPVRLRDDGSFAVRFRLADRRHILPVVASSCDGSEQRTVIISIDRNTKSLDPLVRESDEQ